jgi:hypothetical protein
MKQNVRRFASLILLAASPLAGAAGTPMAVRLECNDMLDTQLVDLVRSNNQCVENLKSGANTMMSVACRASLTRAEALADSAPVWPPTSNALGAMTLAAVYSNVALAHWTAGNQQRAEKLIAMAAVFAPEAGFVARNRLLIEVP